MLQPSFKNILYMAKAVVLSLAFFMPAPRSMADDRPMYVHPIARHLTVHWFPDSTGPYAGRCMRGPDSPSYKEARDFGRFKVAGKIHCHFKSNDPDGVWPYRCPAGYQFTPKITEYLQWFASTWNDVANQCQRTVVCPFSTYGSASLNECRQVFAEDDLEEKPQNGETCPRSGNPIATASGNKFQSAVDFHVGPLQFTRYYNSDDRQNLGMGYGWRHQFQARIIPMVRTLPRPANTLTFAGPPASAAAQQADTSTQFAQESPPPTPSYYLVERPDGKSFSFHIDGTPAPGATPSIYRLQVKEDGFVITDGIVTEEYTKTGMLKSVYRPGSGLVTLNYRPDGLLANIASDLGWQFNLSYGAGNRLQMVEANGVYIQYDYDTSNRLASVIYPDGSQQAFHYEDANPYLLTGITDEAGARYATWRYNAKGEAISSEHAGGLDKVTLTFTEAGTTRTTEEIDPLGSVRRYHFTKNGKRWLLTGKDQPGGAGCDPASSALAYDTNGNIKTRTDFNGVTTSYIYDLTRNLETSRTEAAGTPQARTISTTWHPTFRLPATITEPGRVTEFTYDPTKGLLTQKKVTADGVSRIEAWTYFPNGLVQTATDARGKVTSYAYDAQGNLATVTDPAGLVTQFTRYDLLGNPLTMISANGVTTTFAYDKRRRLKTRTTGGELTQFAYKPTGLLEKVTFPDQSWLQYRYDPAHRLIGIDHSNGSRVEYPVIDNAGNIKREDRYDPAGVLVAAQQAATQAQSVTTAPKAQ